MSNRFCIVLTFTLISISVFASGTMEKNENELIIFNAASTTDLIIDAGKIFYDKTGISVKTNPASSGTLARQITEGADANIYISASEKWTAYVNENGYSVKSASLLVNDLVLIAPAESTAESFILSFDADLPGRFQGRISTGDPAHVPAGMYAEQALDYFNWKSVLAERIQPASDVRAALMVVELGECELGIVYRTDAEKSNKVKIISVFPDESHIPIVYFISALTDDEITQKFYSFMLQDEDVKNIYNKYGFTFNG